MPACIIRAAKGAGEGGAERGGVMILGKENCGGVETHECDFSVMKSVVLHNIMLKEMRG